MFYMKSSKIASAARLPDFNAPRKLEATCSKRSEGGKGGTVESGAIAVIATDIDLVAESHWAFQIGWRGLKEHLNGRQD